MKTVMENIHDKKCSEILRPMIIVEFSADMVFELRWVDKFWEGDARIFRTVKDYLFFKENDLEV